MTGNVTYPVGVLFSRSGSYAQPAGQGFGGAMAAIEHVNASRRFPFRLEAHHFDPAGEADRYAPFCRQLIREHCGGLHHLLEPQGSDSRGREARRAALVSMRL